VAATIRNPRTLVVAHEYSQPELFWRLVRERREDNLCRISRLRLDLHDRGVHLRRSEQARRAACGCP
jgi:hypothetical protein